MNRDIVLKIEILYTYEANVLRKNEVTLKDDIKSEYIGNIRTVLGLCRKYYYVRKVHYEEIVAIKDCNVAEFIFLVKIIYFLNNGIYYYSISIC
jgi:hypothetical protein